MQRFTSVGFLVAGGTALLAATVYADTFHIVPGTPNLVRFESKAPLETFDGKSREVEGHVRLDPNAIEDWIEVQIEVDLASFDTGIAIRNRHMRENHLETDRYPRAVFKGGRVHEASGSRLRLGETLQFEIEGVLSLHGVDKPLRAPVTLTHEVVDGVAQLRVAAAFQVKLSDHQIKRPKFLVMKLDEVQRINVELIAKAGE